MALAGTPAGARLAMGLALVSAVAHALFGALQKGRHDPWLSRGAIDAWIFVLAAPMALFLVEWPHPPLWGLLAGALAVHFAYKMTMALAYERAAYTVVYPVVRGSGPLATVTFAALFLGEHYTAAQWFGVGCLSAGILALAVLNLRGVVAGRAAIRAGLAWAVAGGLLVAVYTTYDAYSIRQSRDPFTFLAWFFFVTAVDFPVIAAVRYARGPARPAPGPLLARGLVGALVAFVSFGGVMLATRLGQVGQAAVLRETSTVFAAGIGWLVLRERVGPARLALMALIAAGAVIVQVAARGT